MQISYQRLIRVITDIIFIQISLISAFIARYIVVVFNNAAINTHGLINDYIAQYSTTFWILTSITIALFYGLGVYHHVRAYRQRFKIVVLFQAITVAHLGYGFILYLTRWSIIPPRGVILLSWIICCVLLIGIRVTRLVFQIFEKNEQLIIKPAKTTKNVLVLGGAGYIGSLVVRQLLEQGYTVRLIDMLLYGDQAIRELYDHAEFEFIKGDFRHIETIVRALNGMDAVIHLGAIVGDPACAIDEDFSTEINLIATRMLAEACKGYGIQRFIFASTCSVYGASDELLNERSKLNPVSLYAQTKIDSENILLAMADDTFSPTILRFSTIYGLSPRPRFDLVINVLTAKAVREGKITIFGGDQWRPFVHVADAARSLLLVLQAPLEAIHSEVFNVGSEGQNYTINQIGDMIHELIPESEVIQEGVDIDKRNYRVSFEKILKHLDFQPHYTVEDGIREIQKALEEGDISDYYDPYFNNYKYLTDHANSELRKLTTPWQHSSAVPLE